MACKDNIIAGDETMYYGYCPDCGDEYDFTYPTGIGTRKIDRVVKSQLIDGAINYTECECCGGKNSGFTATKSIDTAVRVYLRAVIHLNASVAVSQLSKN